MAMIATGDDMLKVALVVVSVVLVSFGFWYFSLSSDSDILVLDKSVLTVVLDELPIDAEGALSVARDEVSNVTGVPDSALHRYFRLRNVSRTQFQWLILYNVTGNPDLSVYLMKRISADEGFRISDNYIVGLVGIAYFNAHFRKETFDSDSNTAHYTFRYHYSGEEIELPLWVKLRNDRTVTDSSVVNTPQEVAIGLDQALEIARTNGLQDPRSGYPVVTGGVLCWRVVWEHTPTEQDYDAQIPYGLDIHCTTGEVLRTLRYKRQKPSPIQATHIAALAHKLGLEALEDGAVLELRVLNSSAEEFFVTKTFGRVVVKEGTNEDADITLWIARELILQALNSDDAIGYVQKHASNEKVRIELHKNMVILQKKGYSSLYERLK
jgi:hypothetical protein